MFPTGKPDLRAVFFWISGLDTSEKRSFATLFKPPKKSKAQFWTLYEGLSKLETYDENAIRSLIPGKHFTRNLETLLEKLIYWQLFSQKDQAPKLYIIQKAIEVGAFELVTKVLREEVRTCFRLSRYARLLMLKDWMEEVSLIFGVHLWNYLELPYVFPHTLVMKIEQHQAWREAISQLNWAFMATGKKREYFIEHAFGHIDAIKGKTERLAQEIPNDLRLEILQGSVAARVALLRNNLDECILKQHQVATLVSETPELSMAEKLHEANILIHLYALTASPLAAVGMLQFIRGLQPGNPLEESFQYRFLVRAEMGLVERLWDVKRAGPLGEQLLARPEAFLEANYPVLIYKIALVHFVNGDYSGTLKWLREYHALPTQQRARMQVWAELLEMATYYSLEDLETVDRCMKRVKGVVKESNSEYADLVFRTLKAISHIKAVGREYEVALPFKDEFQSLLERWSYPDEIWYFDFIQWLEARKRKMTCLELHRSGEEGWRWSGHMDEIDPAWSMFKVFYPTQTQRDGVIQMLDFGDEEGDSTGGDS